MMDTQLTKRVSWNSMMDAGSKANQILPQACAFLAWPGQIFAMFRQFPVTWKLLSERLHQFLKSGLSQAESLYLPWQPCRQEFLHDL